jgi:TM2 domain-containing membrane protein YozV
MRGQILDFSMRDNSGVISGADGQRYYFTRADWHGDRPPVRGMEVDFETDGNKAQNVYIAISSTVSGSKNRIAAGLLAIFLGGLGIHKFYLGFTGPGLVYLLINTIGFFITWALLFIPNAILGIFALIEGIIYLTKSDEEFERLYVIERRQWF